MLNKPNSLELTRGSGPRVPVSWFCSWWYVIRPVCVCVCVCVRREARREVREAARPGCEETI